MKAAADFGGLAVLAGGMMLLYRLLDKWGGAFVEAQKGQTTALAQQASAVTSLVETVKDSQGDQREVLMAVRMQSEKIDRQGKYLEGIDDFVRGRVQALAAADAEQAKELAKLSARWDAKVCGFSEAVGKGGQ
jgi:hypothetical protein